MNKLKRLNDILRKYDKLCVAFSGGRDSEFILAAAVRAGIDTVAVTVVSPLFTHEELQRAKKMAAALNAEHIVADFDPFSLEGFCQNPANRCYICKKGMLEAVAKTAHAKGYYNIADGTSLDDADDYRPGLQATREQNIIHPLLEAGLTKNEISAQGKSMGLMGWDLPSAACLATRIPTGFDITHERLRRIESAEKELAALGFSRVRVRCRDEGAKLELDNAELAGQHAAKIKEICNAHGFSQITEISTASAAFTIAAVEIGAEKIVMDIVNILPDGGMRSLEHTENIIPIGTETFEEGKLSTEKINALCAVLKGCGRLMKDYGAKAHRIVATSAVREAENCDFFLEQVRLQTGMSIDVISNAQERMLMFKCLEGTRHDFDQLRQNGMLIAQIGGGNLQLSAYCNGRLTLSRSLPLGIVRISGMLSDIMRNKLNRAKIIEEYIDSRADCLKRLHDWRDLKAYIVVCQTNELRHLFPNGRATKSTFMKLCAKVLRTGAAGMESRQLLALLAAKKFFELTQAKEVIMPSLSLSAGVIYDLAEKQNYHKKDAQLLNDVLSSARSLAMRYKCHQEHFCAVEQHSQILFDHMQPLHGLGAKERMLLRMAAILHECGKLISVTKSYSHSYEIIMATGFIGISEQDLKIAANAAMHYTPDINPIKSDKFNNLGRKNRVTAAKLIAILRLADALDIGHRQRVKIIAVDIRKDSVNISVRAESDPSLERWAFNEGKGFFGEVFGVTANLEVIGSQ